jgi:hypothetical protein
MLSLRQRELGRWGVTRDEGRLRKNLGRRTVREDLNGRKAPKTGAQSAHPGTPVAIQALTNRELLAQSDQNDWRTPRKYLDAVREVMGAIDLDPASSKEANETVQAKKFYTEADNGLVAIGRASSRRREIGSPVSAQYP